MNRALLFLAAFVALALFAACESQTGPDAPPRTNGCIDTECQVSSSSGGSSSGSSDAGADAE